MADLTNVYSNPYLPSFVNQRPRVANNSQYMNPVGPISPVSYSQIHSVSGFEGARAYNLANGASEILAESDPNLSRIYVVAVDANGQRFVEGFRLTPEEEPKPVTMDDLSEKMNQLLERMNKLEEEKTNGQSNSGSFNKVPKQSFDAKPQPNGRIGQNGSKPSGGDATDNEK